MQPEIFFIKKRRVANEKNMDCFYNYYFGNLFGFYNGKILDSKVIRVKKAYPAYFDSYKDIDKVRK